MVAVHTVSLGRCLKESELAGDMSTGMMLSPALLDLMERVGLFCSEILFLFHCCRKSVWAVVTSLSV